MPGKGKKTVPEGWLDYQPFRRVVPRTKFLPFKVPLKKEIVQNLPKEEWFTPEMILQEHQRVRLVIDLTATERYYDPRIFRDNGIKHVKILVQGGGQLPDWRLLNQFCDAVDEFRTRFRHDKDALIGVHCTHGLHRTGFFICYYLVTRLGFNPSDALREFEVARGYTMKRRNYINAIRALSNHS